MGMNQNYFYDFDAEPLIENWVATRTACDCYIIATTFKLSNAGEYTLLFGPRHPPEKWKILSIKIAGREYQACESSIAYISPNSSGGLRYAFHADLPTGVHAVELRVQSNVEGPETGFKATWIVNSPRPLLAPSLAPRRFTPALATPPTDMHVKGEGCADQLGVEAPQPQKNGSASPIFNDFTPGIGTDVSLSAGRFGYTKGDGVLDCAMPILGIIDKMYLCGHPQYKKPYKWTCAVLPPGIDPQKAYHGSAPPARAGLENDEIIANHLSVKWKTSLAATADFFERKSGAKVDFACTYSLASPGILVETSDPGITLSMLEYAGNYQYLLVPKKDGVHSVPLDGDLSFAGEMTENWLLLYGATEFPDVPILLVFTRAPDTIRMRRNPQGWLTALDFHVPAVSGQDTKIFFATPFGIESFDPAAAPAAAVCPAPCRRAAVDCGAGLPDACDEKFIADAIERCRFWSRALLAYPIKCAEYYQLDEPSKTVEIFQKFKYREFSDQWQTASLKTAPLPPPLTILDGTGTAEFDKDVHDYRFPTKYGYFKGAIGRDYVGYTLPYMPRARRFPLRDTRDKQISDLLADGMDEYFNFHEQFGPDKQAYPYAGSALEPFAWSASMFNFMEADSRARLFEKLSERLLFSCNPERRYVYPAIQHSALMREMPGIDRVLEIYRDPAMKHLKLYNWYWRKEPFTGLQYRICYLNVCLFSSGKIKTGSRAEIAELKMPLIENDWGAGLAFYYIYLAAQISGDFSAVRQNWATLCEGFDYFAKLHDWACMATAYSDNGISWVEGANYGAFTAFVNLAEAVGDQDAYAKGVYLAAKQFALRLAQFRSAQTYFYKYFAHAPWYITKLFHEEATPGSGFLHVPELWRGKYTEIYNLTTEGLYPELFTGLAEFLPQEWNWVRDMAMQAYADGLKHHQATSYAEVQACSSCLIAAALDATFPAEQLREDITAVEQRGHLIKEWRGIHIYSRLLPKNYFKCQLLAWLAGRCHPVWLEYWVDVEILRADYDSENQVATIEFRTRAPHAVIRLGTRGGLRNVCLNGKRLAGWHLKEQQLSVPVRESGKLEMFFVSSAKRVGC